MKKLLLFILVIPFVAYISSSCTEDETKTTWEEYAEWRTLNNDFLKKASSLTNPDGSAYYERINPSWNPGVYILIHYFNDRAETAGNLTPIFTSKVSVKYKGMLYNDTPFDSSYTQVDSLYKTGLSNVIAGWQIALQNMHVGDTCEVLIPYEAGYGATGSGVIPPFSTLKFGMKLVDINSYEIRP